MCKRGGASDETEATGQCSWKLQNGLKIEYCIASNKAKNLIADQQVPVDPEGAADEEVLEDPEGTADQEVLVDPEATAVEKVPEFAAKPAGSGAPRVAAPPPPPC
eukprot:3815424-Lingulodinium_polyedra.AAC.1